MRLPCADRFEPCSSRAAGRASKPAASAIASSSSGSTWGRKGGTGSHSAGFFLSRGMTPARASEDFTAGGAEQQHETRRLAPLAPECVQSFECLEDVLAASKEDRRVLLLEGQQARIRGSLGVPVEDIQRIEPPFEEADSEPLIAFLWPGREVDVLDVAKDTAASARPHFNRKDRFAALPRLYQLGKTPLRDQPVRCQ